MRKQPLKDMLTVVLMTAVFNTLIAVVFGMFFSLPIIYYFFSQRRLMESQQQIQAEKIKRLTMEKEAAMSTLRVLQAQIEPHFLFAPLIIQPLVENSIKYGLEPKIEGGSIVIHCSIQRGFLEISIVDTGRGLDETTDTAGIGIDNVSQRLETIYGDQASLTLENNQPHGTRAVIKVPI